MKGRNFRSVAKSATLGTAATAALFSLPHEADAAIVYSGPQNITVNAPANGNMTALIPVNTVGLGDLRILANHAGSFGEVAADGVNGTSNGVLQQGGFLRKLASGSVISAGAVGGFAPQNNNRVIKFMGTAGSSGLFASNVDALAGFRFKDGSGVHYGWIRLRWNDHPAYGNNYPASLTAIDWAVQSTPGASIQAGAGTPEPSTALLALAGLGGVALLRRRASRKA